jgi:hypothetical protein
MTEHHRTRLVWLGLGYSRTQIWAGSGAAFVVWWFVEEQSLRGVIMGVGKVREGQVRQGNARQREIGRYQVSDWWRHSVEWESSAPVRIRRGCKCSCNAVQCGLTTERTAMQQFLSLLLGTGGKVLAACEGGRCNSSTNTRLMCRLLRHRTERTE